MSDVTAQIAGHYSRSELGQAILAAFEALGRPTAPMDEKDFAAVSELHTRGRAATEELGAALQPKAGEHALDVGSGLGGAACYFAAHFSCHVTGIDLSADLCNAARLLAENQGLGQKVDFRRGDATLLPFATASFDLAYSQHVAMNIADKARLYAEIARVLKPGGRFGLYDLVQGSGDELYFPVPWAEDASMSFLVTPDMLKTVLAETGFMIESCEDVTARARDWSTRRAASTRPAVSGLRLLYGESAKAMIANVARNLAEGRVLAIRAFCRKP
jgi:ubiquinone/menaquinone biosynthesis C-methylase UbiE